MFQTTNQLRSSMLSRFLRLPVPVRCPEVTRFQEIGVSGNRSSKGPNRAVMPKKSIKRPSWEGSAMNVYVTSPFQAYLRFVCVCKGISSQSLHFRVPKLRPTRARNALGPHFRWLFEILSWRFAKDP